MNMLQRDIDAMPPLQTCAGPELTEIYSADNNSEFFVSLLKKTLSVFQFRNNHKQHSSHTNLTVRTGLLR
jgi:hypothetical protein